MVGWIVALISGVLMSIQGVLNTEVTKQTSLWVSTGWVQLSALIVCITAWLIRDRSSVTALMDVSPKYMLLGGVIGALVAYSVLFMFNPVWWLCVTVLISGAVGTARMLLRQHSLAQVVAGTLVGVVCGFAGIILL